MMLQCSDEIQQLIDGDKNLKQSYDNFLRMYLDDVLKVMSKSS